MKKRNEVKAETATKQNNGIVGVIGSIPFASTILTLEKAAKGIELPADWELVPGIRTVDGRKVGYQVLRKTPKKRFENDLNGKKRRNKSA